MKKFTQTRSEYLAGFKARRAMIYAEHKMGMSYNDLARKYRISTNSIAELLKKAKRDSMKP